MVTSRACGVYLNIGGGGEREMRRARIGLERKRRSKEAGVPVRKERKRWGRHE